MKCPNCKKEIKLNETRLATLLSFELGKGVAHGMYRDYPDGFNREINSIAHTICENIEKVIE